MTEIDADCAWVLAATAAAKRPPLWQLSPAEGRLGYLQSVRVLDGDRLELPRVENRFIDGPGGRLPIRIYQPEHPSGGGLVFFHGGGHVIGDLETHDGACRRFASWAKVTVIAVDYRLAPEHKFPAGFDDCLAAWHWVLGAASALGIDAKRLAIGGDSAGGNLAAAVTQALKRQKASLPALQVLIYPGMTVHRESESFRSFADGYLLDAKTIQWFMDNYIGEPSHAADPRASPGLAKDLAGLPPALIYTAGFDPIRDEGHAYADALNAAGVKARYRCYERLIHGFLTMTGRVAAAREAQKDMAAALATALAPKA
ncbi:MAG: alpha/beta hydrolase [Alphaproteobacteria bacterium]|nr:alpha/beta hydrolase [Alphaproteobacteria bacterium]